MILNTGTRIIMVWARGGAGDLATVIGARVEFLPTYSPDFNPIEKGFALVKRWLRKHREYEWTYDDPMEFLELAFHSAITPEGARSSFHSCAYKGEELYYLE